MPPACGGGIFGGENYNQGLQCTGAPVSSSNPFFYLVNTYQGAFGVGNPDIWMIRRSEPGLAQQMDLAASAKNILTYTGPISNPSPGTVASRTVGQQLLGQGVAPGTSPGVYSTPGTQAGLPSSISSASTTPGLSSTVIIFLVIAGLVLALK